MSNAPAIALGRYIDESPTPWHAAKNAAAALTTSGFERSEAADQLLDSPSGFIVRDGSLIAWSWPDVAEDKTNQTQFRIIGAHTDSPNLRIRPRPDTGKAGLKQLGVEVYGGALVNSWLDLDLTLAGRVQLRNGSTELFHHTTPVLRVPQLAIHLDREIATDGLKLNKQVHLTPVWGVGRPTAGEFQEWLASEVAVKPSDILSWDVACADTRPSALFGANDEFLAAARLDNLCSSYGAIEALVAQDALGRGGPSIVALFDHEEVGSTSTTGAASAWLRQVLERLSIARGLDRSDFLRALGGSRLLSADMAHATHPNYVDRHEPDHHIEMGAGPVIKFNSNARYATESGGAAEFRRACEAARVGVQQYSHRGDLPCGSTIGPTAAAELGVDVTDVGMAQLSMHSSREMMAGVDVQHMTSAFSAWLALSG